MGIEATAAETSSLARLVDQSMNNGRNYYSGRCGPLLVRYYTADQYPLAAGSPVNDSAKKYAWFGVASLEANTTERTTMVEYLQTRGEGTFAMDGRQRDQSGQWLRMRTPSPNIGPDRDMTPRWIKLDMNRIQSGAPFTWVFLANAVAPEARQGEYEFRPVEPEVFRINGTETCEIMPDFARIAITP
ncbi:MAG: hypothetical protein DI616_06920 [Paracoccus denitrificans]|uniref:Uncharacterized protein n=1 Tax=Paracoccus denitrificans TaxID=266 RepID=A0A533IA70_PARDE|nr:MAG: hypothetical protein DI616_06920 [Paracoccus denitrificans]